MISIINHLTLTALLLLTVTAASVLASEPVQVTEAQVCGLNSQATELAQLIKQHPSQKRPLLQCDQLLSSIAQQRAEALATNRADPNVTPNQYVIKSGFRVPNYYPVTGNQVEAVAKEYKQAEAALKYLNESGKHHNHVMGKGDFFSLQSQLGVGFYAAQDATEHDQWVVLMAEPWQAPEFVYKQEFKMPVKMAKGCDQDWKNSGDQFLIRKCRSLGRSKPDNLEDVALECDANSCEKK